MAPIIVQPNRAKLTDDQIAAEKRRMSNLGLVKLGAAILGGGAELSEGMRRKIERSAAEVAAVMKGGSPER